MKPTISKSFKDIGLSPIVEISERAKTLAPGFEKNTGKPFIYFQRGEVGFDTPDYILQAVSEAALVKKLTKYPKSGGEPWFKDAILSHLAEMGIEGLERDNVVGTYGGQEGLELVFGMFEGAKVASFGPIWSCMLENILPYSKSEVELIPFKEEDGELKIDPDDLERVVSNSDIFYLNTPQNPSGKVFSKEEMSLVNEICKKQGVVIVSDEAYKDIVFDGKKHTSMLEFDGDHIFSVFTGSKSFAATGFRVGYTVNRGKDFVEMLKRGNYTQTAGVVPMMQYAFAEALNNKEERDAWLDSFVTELQGRRDTAYSEIKQFLGDVYKPEGSFYFFLNLNDHIVVEDKDRYLLETLMNKGVAVVPGSSFGQGFEGYVRLSFSTVNADLVGEGIRRIKNNFSF